MRGELRAMAERLCACGSLDANPIAMHPHNQQHARCDSYHGAQPPSTEGGQALSLPTQVWRKSNRTEQNRTELHHSDPPIANEPDQRVLRGHESSLLVVKEARGRGWFEPQRECALRENHRSLSVYHLIVVIVEAGCDTLHKCPVA